MSRRVPVYEYFRARTQFLDTCGKAIEHLRISIVLLDRWPGLELKIR